MQNMTIVDRVCERLKTQPLGDLITEEDLHDIVKEAIPRTFFTPRIDNSNYNRRELPPLINEIMHNALKDNVADAVKQWMEENSEVMVEYWNKVMDENLLAYVQKIQDEMATAQVKSMLSNWVHRINTERSNRGQAPLQPFY